MRNPLSIFPIEANWPEERRVLRNRVGLAAMLVALYYFGFFQNAVPNMFYWLSGIVTLQLLVNGLGIRARWNWLPSYNLVYDQFILIFLIGISGGTGENAVFMVFVVMIGEIIWLAQAWLVPWLTGLQIFNLASGNLLALTLGVSPSWEAAVVGALSVIAVATFLAEPVSRLQREASLDPLTNVLNRRAGLTRLEAWTRDRTRFCLLFIDLKGFKSINDTYGHHVGDELLKAVAGRLRHGVRPEDLAIRYGGDEFLNRG